MEKAPRRILGTALDFLASAAESLVAPPTTPEQKREAAQAAGEREDEAAQKIDFSRYTADRERDRQQEQEREARKRQRSERER